MALRPSSHSQAAAFAARVAYRRARSTLAIAQPTAGTHPHLVGPGEVTPGVTRAEYAQRRAMLAAALPVGSVALFPSAPLAYISHDVPHLYAQSPDLHYLCGFLEANCLLACSKPWGGVRDGGATWHLFVEPVDPAQALWDGPRAGVAGARQHILSDGEVHPIRTAPRVLREIVDAAVAGAPPPGSAVGAPGGSPSLPCLLFDSSVNPTITKSLSPLLEASAQKLRVMRASPLVERLRLRKSASEVGLMRHAAQTTAEAFVVTMGESAAAAARGDQLEGLLAARFEFETKRRGCGRLAYPCVVASGTNAVTLHYMHNNARLTPGDLLLMDAGGSYFGYSADITRTWPLSGSFTPAQRDIYEAVLSVNERVIQAVRADGTTSLQTLHQLSIRLTHEALVSLGILKQGDLQRVSKYYPHAIGHYLGMDVHDTPNASQSQASAPRAEQSQWRLRAIESGTRAELCCAGHLVTIIRSMAAATADGRRGGAGVWSATGSHRQAGARIPLWAPCHVAFPTCPSPPRSLLFYSQPCPCSQPRPFSQPCPCSQPLVPRMVLTVEPGLYFPTDDESIPAWCRGIGVRIEDDVLVDEQGCADVLTSGAPKSVAAVEDAVRAGL
jgi:Xaa-Pro aminopeptidase